MMNNYSKYYRGSEWRKWDLHFHAPSKYTCAKNDQFEGNGLEEKQRNFISDLKAVSDISVIGITDYFSLEGYKFVSSHKDDLKGFDLILPNIELRITPVTGSNRKINLHVIPNSTVLKVDKIERFLYKFEFGPEKYTCKEEDLIRLGKKMDHSLSPEEAFKKGLNEFCISYDKFFEIFNDLPQEIKRNILIGISNNSGDGASGIKDVQGIRDIVYSGVHFIFSAKPSDKEYFLGKHNDKEEVIKSRYGGLKPCLHGCDFHGSKDGKIICVPDMDRFCWIKADPTFEGLKQVIYEPEDRVRIQANLPEDKAGYQVIDKIEINNPLIYNTHIEFNPNLNSIIGGRSTGKSILLGAIAKKLKTVRSIELPDSEYDMFVKTISDSIKIIWKDGQEEDNREIEYFQQGYMHEIARDDNELSKLIQDILNQKGKEAILVGYNKSVAENSKYISALISDFFQIQNDIYEKEQKVRDKGDKKGIEDEIKRLTVELKELNVTEVSPEEQIAYDKIKENISKATQSKQTFVSDIQQMGSLKEASLFKESIAYDTTSISDDRKKEVENIFNILKKDAIEKWQRELEGLIQKIEKDLHKQQELLDSYVKGPIYLKVSKAYAGNVRFSEYEHKIRVQEDKLFEITTLINEIGSLKKQKDELKDNIIKGHQTFYTKIDTIIPELSDSKDGLEIKAKAKFNGENYRSILSSGINQKSYENQELVNFKYVDNQSYEDHVFGLLDSLINEDLTLKSGYNGHNLSTAILSANFYQLSYDLEYEGDDFKKMSDGKKAFVVLKLLLDFNDKDCPILIDQPEDDLDNRAIYQDLVQYLKKKKQKRQIIVATHNPNIVVGADSELIICANQHGEKNANTNNIKFQYVTGSLEHTFEKIKDKIEVLEAQGIREHVCEVLEGGDIAFKLRERKYSIR
jgi:predicted ATP-dependent endonuclease of OLD family